MSAILKEQPEKRVRLTGKEFIAVAVKYSRKVIKQKYQCRTMKLACKNFLGDIKRQKSKDFEYYLNDFKVAHFCWFAENMPHIKGDLSKLPFPDNLLKLEPWQVFIFVNIFGWVDKETHNRRYTEAYIKVPRKNGKSPIASCVGNYMFAADGEPGAEVLAGASSKDQANAVFEPALAMVKKTPGFCNHFGVKINAWSMVKPDSSKFERLIGNPGDGGNIHCALIDEYHEHKNNRLFDTMKTGTVARSQPLVFVITTAGTDISYPCYEHEKECIAELEKNTNPNRFVAIWGIDNEKDWKTLSWLKAANPNYGVSVNKKKLLEALEDAKRNPRKQSIFKQKHCNIWTTGSDAFFNMEHWASAADSTLKEEDFSDCQRYHGVDIASIEDIASDVRIYKREEKDGYHYYIFGNHYVPDAVKNDPDLVAYRSWIESGDLTATRGDKIDHFEIGNKILKRNAQNAVGLVGYDGFQAEMLTTYLSNGNDDFEGIEVEKILKVVQSKKYLSDTMKFMSAELKAGTIHHNNNLAMNWMVSNVMVRNWDYLYDNFAPIKANRQSKIDGAVALLIGVAVMNSIEEEPLDMGFLSSSATA